MRLFSPRRRYEPLLGTDSPISYENEKTDDGSTSNLSQTFVLLLSLVCAAANAFMIFNHPPTRPTQLTRDDIGKLRRPSQYIRFDEVERPSPPTARNFTNFPRLLTQVDSSKPALVFGDDPLRYMSHVGMVSPESKRMLVTNSISTIAQFRAIDYGMGICELHLRVPDSAGAFALSIHRLDNTPIIARKLSHHRRPRRVTKVAEVRLGDKHEVHWHRQFTCSEEELLTFEVACSPLSIDAGVECSLEWWQENDDRQPGMFLIQHATK